MHMAGRERLHKISYGEDSPTCLWALTGLAVLHHAVIVFSVTEN